MKLTREAILSTPENVTSFVEVAVPEWNGTVYVRPMTGSRRDRFEQAALKDPSNNLRARMVVYSACDEKGVFLFDENDILALGDQPASALDRIFEAAVEVNALRPKDVSSLEKN